MKNSVKYILQRALGFHSYLYTFAKYKIRTLKSDEKENDFFYFLQLLNDGNGLVLDIGANLGIMSVHLAQALPSSTIHAFEPMPDNRLVFKRVIGKFKLKNVIFHEIALGEDEGTVKMIMPRNGRTRMQGLSHVKHETITEWNEGEEFDVPISKLDTVFNGEAIQGIKIDVENFEYFVLKGGERIIDSNKPIIYAELWDNENRQNCFEFLQKHGYQTYIVQGEKHIPFDSEKHHVQNFIFIAN